MIRKEKIFMKMQERYSRKICRISTFFAEDSLVRLFQLLENGEDLVTAEGPYFLRLQELLGLSDLHFCVLRMFPESCRMTKAGHFRPSLLRFLSWGTMSHGRCLTARISVSPKQERECILSDILESDVPAKYFLSETQMRRLLCSSSADAKGIVSMQTAEPGLPSQAAPEASGGKTGLYQIALPIKVATKEGFQEAHPGDSIDLAYPNLNTRRGRVGRQIAHTVLPSAAQGCFFIDLNEDAKLTDHARCITTRQDNAFSHHKAEKSGVFVESQTPRAVISPAKEKTRQNGRRIKEPNEPMFTLTVTDRHGILHHGRVRKLTPLECWRLQGFTDGQYEKAKNAGIPESQLYKLAGNAVSVPVITALGEKIKRIYEEMESEGGR